MQIYEIFQKTKTKKVNEQLPVVARPGAQAARVPAAAVGGVPNPMAQRMPGGMATTARQTGTMAAPATPPNAGYSRVTSNVPQMQRPAQPATTQQARLPVPQTSRAMVPANRPAPQSPNVPAVVQRPQPAPQSTNVPATVPGQGPRQQINVDDIIDAPIKPRPGQQKPGTQDTIDVSAREIPDPTRPQAAGTQQRNIPVGQAQTAQQAKQQGTQSAEYQAAQQQLAQNAAAQSAPAAQTAPAQQAKAQKSTKDYGAYNVLQDLAKRYVSSKSGIPTSWMPDEYDPTGMNRIWNRGKAKTTAPAAPGQTTPTTGAQTSEPATTTAQPAEPATTTAQPAEPQQQTQQPSADEIRAQKQAAAAAAAQAQMAAGQTQQAAAAGQTQQTAAAQPAPTRPATPAPQGRLPAPPVPPRLAGPKAPTGKPGGKPPAPTKPPAPPSSTMRGARAGAPTPEEYANLERRLQQALAQQAKKKK